MKIFELLKDNPMAAAIIGGAPIAAIITYVLNQLKWIPTTLFNLILFKCNIIYRNIRNFLSS